MANKPPSPGPLPPERGKGVFPAIMQNVSPSLILGEGFGVGADDLMEFQACNEKTPANAGANRGCVGDVRLELTTFQV